MAQYGSSMQKTPPVVLNLIIINVLVWVAQLIFDRTFGLSNMVALYPLNSGNFSPYQLVTHMFAHAWYDRDGIVLSHILFNMLALWMFGSILERMWGPKRFLIFYLACGLAAGVAHILFVQYAPAVGASGAIMGLLAAFAYLFPNTEMYIFGALPIKAKFVVAIYAAVDLFGGFGGSNDNIAHFAHLGGLVMGFILVIIWNKTNKKTFY
ncbi:MAG: rhomboid family intramembrane serine protease [Ginsengibacter sp.]